MPGDVRCGLEALATLEGQEGPEALEAGVVLGPVATLFRPKQDKFLTALENTAGARLFHVVVRDDAVAARVIAHYRMHKSGRVTLLPLAQLRETVAEPQYPDDSRCFPLLRCVEFDEALRPVMVSLFGGTLLCPDLEAATEAARLYHMDCVTIAGEKVAKRGAMRGGYFDSRSSRLRLWRSVTAKEEEARAKQAAVAANQQKLEAIHQVGAGEGCEG